MTPKPSRADIFTAQVLREQQWAYERTLEHLSYREMRALANRAPADGGLGYDLSETALKNLVRGYLDSMKDVLAIDREAHIVRELADLDRVQRLAASMTGSIDYEASLANAKMLGFSSVEELMTHSPMNVVRLSAAERLRAVREYRSAGESRRKFLGLDAATEVKVDVTVRDGMLDDLNDALARLGEAPIETPERTS